VKLFCSTCRAFFEPNDMITKVVCEDRSIEYHHSKCVGAEANISYIELKDVIYPSKWGLTSKRDYHKREKEQHKCAYDACQKLTVSKYCSRVCANRAKRWSTL